MRIDRTIIAVVDTTDDHIRLTYCYSDSELKEGLDRLESFIRKLEGK